MINILVTIYLGKKETILVKDIKPEVRYKATLDALVDNFSKLEKVKLYLLCTGDKNSIDHLSRDLKNVNNFPDFSISYYSQEGEIKNKGTGYLEAVLLRKFLKDKENQMYLKISGKYKIENLSAVVNFVFRKNLCFGWKNIGKKMVDTRCVYINKEILYNNNFDIINDAEGYYFEHAMYDSLDKTNIGLIKGRPIINGLSGTDGLVISTARWKKLLIQTLA